MMMDAGLPAGVINFVPGRAAVVGDICLAHRELAGIHFTGSTRLFRQMWRDVANNLENLKSYPRIVGETGGKDFIVAQSDDDSTDTKNNKKLDKSFGTTDSAVGQEMIAAAIKSISPDHLESFIESCPENKGDSDFRVTKANRPISADGLPVVGFVEKGLYVAVTHSGITLAPIIGELASYEIEESLTKQNLEELFSQERCGFQILDAYRPTRFIS